MPSLEFIREPRVIDAQAMEHSRLQIMHMNRVGDDVVTEIVGLAEADAALDAAAGEPHGEASRMMITPVIGVRQRALAVNRASELAAPDHERVLKHAALFQIPDESG